MKNSTFIQHPFGEHLLCTGPEDWGHMALPSEELKAEGRAQACHQAQKCEHSCGRGVTGRQEHPGENPYPD